MLTEQNYSRQYTTQCNTVNPKNKTKNIYKTKATLVFNYSIQSGNYVCLFYGSKAHTE